MLFVLVKVLTKGIEIKFSRYLFYDDKKVELISVPVACFPGGVRRDPGLSEAREAARPHPRKATTRSGDHLLYLLDKRVSFIFSLNMYECPFCFIVCHKTLKKRWFYGVYYREYQPFEEGQA